ncbi:uncharacterized protein LOC135816932 [Sycon ciliatum]|uniref:uncharacterized protein LOC135816932 n=1 Tax=Sycon ciliatum TaxID=27933 RepID=UPI0031F69359
MPILRHLIDACRKSSTLNGHDKLLYQAAMLLVFFGFLRCAEFTNGVTRGCISFPGDGCLQLFLRSSKTGPFGKGVTIDIGPSVPPYFPVHAMVSYLFATRRQGTEQRLFILSNGQQLTRQSFTATVRSLVATAGVPSQSHYSGRSFRIGAATTAAMAGVPDSLIRAAGRWKSDACLRYIRTTARAKRQLSSRLAAVSRMP